MSAQYIYSAPVSGANRYVKKYSTIIYKKLTRELTRNRGGSKCLYRIDFN